MMKKVKQKLGEHEIYVKVFERPIEVLDSLEEFFSVDPEFEYNNSIRWHFASARQQLKDIEEKGYYSLDINKPLKHLFMNNSVKCVDCGIPLNNVKEVVLDKCVDCANKYYAKEYDVVPSIFDSIKEDKMNYDGRRRFGIVYKIPMPKKPKICYKYTMPKSLKKLCHKRYNEYLRSESRYFKLKLSLIKILNKYP